MKFSANKIIKATNFVHNELYHQIRYLYAYMNIITKIFFSNQFSWKPHFNSGFVLTLGSHHSTDLEVISTFDFELDEFILKF